MRALLGLALAVTLGCSHDARPAVAPDEHPPLPPASGTPIGYLIDDATELHLRDEQVTQLKQIDESLVARLDVLDTELRGSNPPAAAATPDGGRHRGGRHGGGRRGGMGGSNPSGSSPSGSSPGAGAGSGNARPSPSGHGNAGAANRATEERAADVRDALQRAFALFDPTQQQIARRVLADHGVDVDAGRSPAAPAAAEPAEPDTGSDGS